MLPLNYFKTCRYYFTNEKNRLLTVTFPGFIYDILQSSAAELRD